MRKLCTAALSDALTAGNRSEPMTKRTGQLLANKGFPEINEDVQPLKNLFR